VVRVVNAEPTRAMREPASGDGVCPNRQGTHLAEPGSQARGAIGEVETVRPAVAQLPPAGRYSVPLRVMLPRFWVASTKPEAALVRSQG
jgi:hypothetical protein